jgi:hypothetical protein
MAKKQSKAQQAQAAAMKARNNPYVRRVMEDEDLRHNITDAYTSARKAYGRLSNGKSPTNQIFDDRKLQKELMSVAESIKDAGYALRGPKKKKKKRGGIGKLLLLVIVSAGVALAVSEGLRKKVLDALFGAEEEFEYSSTTTASTPSSGEGAGPTPGETAGTTT